MIVEKASLKLNNALKKRLWHKCKNVRNYLLHNNKTAEEFESSTVFYWWSVLDSNQ